VSGAGTEDAGIGDAGFDSLVTTPATPISVPDAIQFDPQYKVFPFASDGQLASMHPVDQAAVLALRPKGSIRSAPDQGIDIARIKTAPRSALQATITDEVQLAWATLIARGDILFLGAPLHPEANGRPIFYADYQNLRLPGAPARRLNG